MAMNYKPSMTKAELLEIATANGVQADDGMTKTAILAALDGANSRAPDGAELNTSPEETAADGQQAAQSGAGQAGDREGTEDTAGQETPAEDAQEAPEGYNLFVYAGPSLPRGRLKENAVFNGTFEDVKAYLADVIADYPLVARMIVPVERLSAFHVKVKTPGNLAHKYYNDIVSTMRGNKEV